MFYRVLVFSGCAISKMWGETVLRFRKLKGVESNKYTALTGFGSVKRGKLWEAHGARGIARHQVARSLGDLKPIQFGKLKIFLSQKTSGGMGWKLDFPKYRQIFGKT